MAFATKQQVIFEGDDPDLAYPPGGRREGYKEPIQVAGYGLAFRLVGSCPLPEIS